MNYIRIFEVYNCISACMTTWKMLDRYYLTIKIDLQAGSER
jgi:hypothetical protein